MGDDENGVCELLAGADGALKSGSGVFVAVGCCAEGGDEDSAGRLRRGFGSLRLRGDFGSQREEGGDEKDQLLHGYQGS